jgi:hypothetical protein
LIFKTIEFILALFRGFVDINSNFSLKNLCSNNINNTYIKIKPALETIEVIAQVIFPKSDEKSIFLSNFCLTTSSLTLNFVK